MKEVPMSRDWTTEDLRALRDEGGISIGSPADREGNEKDFGQLVARATSAVLRPTSIDELERIIAFANVRGLKLTARGRGMSQGGQSIPVGGASLDLSRLTDIDAPDGEARTMKCSAGATWRDAIARAAPFGLMPKVVPLNLDLTIGGLLSVAGIGATSHRHAAAVSCTAEIEVVTGGGRRVTCSETHEVPVYHAALGGLGRLAIIASARLELRPFKPFVRTFYLLYSTIDAWVAAQRALIQSDRAEYIEGFCTPCVQGLRNGPRGRTPFARWFYGLHVTVEYDAGAAPEAAAFLAGLPSFELLEVEDGETVAYAARYDPRFSAMRRSGAWTLPHPWIEAMLPGASIQEILPSLLDIYPVGLGDGPRLLFVNRHRIPPFLKTPDSSELVCCALLPVGIPPHLLPDTLEAFRAIHARIVAGGGKRVLSGWTTMMDSTALLEHYGDQAGVWVKAKEALDPRGVLDTPLTEGELRRPGFLRT
jgi:cytokinin dehydrogenase